MGGGKGSAAVSYAVRCAELELALHDIKDAIESGDEREIVRGIYFRVMRELFGDVGLEYAAAHAGVDEPLDNPLRVRGPDEPLEAPLRRRAA